MNFTKDFTQDFTKDFTKDFTQDFTIIVGLFEIFKHNLQNNN